MGPDSEQGQGSDRERPDVGDRSPLSRLRIVGGAAARLNPELLYLAVLRTGQRVFLDRRGERRPGDQV